MYETNTITTEFTGYMDGDTYIQADAAQDVLLMIDPPIGGEIEVGYFPAFLSGSAGDFTSNGVTLQAIACDGSDITFGNATSKVLSGTLINQDDRLSTVNFSSICQAWIGVATDEQSVTIPAGATCYITGGGHTYCAIDGDLYVDGVAQNVDYHGDIISAVASSGVEYDKPVFFTDQGGFFQYEEVVAPETQNWRYNATGTPELFALISSDWGTYMVNKFCGSPQSLYIGTYDPEEQTIIIYDVQAGVQRTMTYVPMGVFDFSNVAVFGDTYHFEVYDGMAKAEVDASAWVNSLNFRTPLTLAALAAAAADYLGLTCLISTSAVNRTMTIAANPFTDITSLTMRQIIKWLAEAMGTNARISRLGELEFYTYGTASDAIDIYPDTIAAQTRTTGRYVISAPNKLVLYDRTGAQHSVGSGDQVYYILGNPLLNPAQNASCLNNLYPIVTALGGYRATNFVDGSADPRVDAGDMLYVHGDPLYHAIVTSLALTYKSYVSTEYTSVGQAQRTAPSPDEMTSYSSEVNSTPEVVEEKLQKLGSLTLSDGSDEVTLSPAGLKFDDDDASPVTLKVIKRSMNAAGTTTITLQNGIYLAITSHTNNGESAQQGLAIIQVYNTSTIREIAAAANSTLAISGRTLTWTTTNTYRVLRLIRIS